MFNNAIQDIVTQFDNSTTIEAFKQRLISIQKELGFDNLVYLTVSIPSLNIYEPHTVCTYSDNWIDYYFSNDCINTDPVVRASNTAYQPYLWEDLKLSSKEKSFINTAEDFGVARTGVSVPIRRTDGEFALMSVCADTSEKGWKDLMTESFPVITMVADYYHNCLVNNFFTRRSQTDQVYLTEREKECLLWTARGKNNWDIANILNISERTVTYHIGNACQKLGVYNRPHAVMKAITSRLIFP